MGGYLLPHFARSPFPASTLQMGHFTSLLVLWMVEIGAPRWSLSTRKVIPVRSRLTATSPSLSPERMV